MEGSYYAVRIALFIWWGGVVASAPLWLHAQVPNTEFYGSPGTSYSERFHGRQAVSLALSATRIFQVLAVCGFLTFRGYSSEVLVFWTILMAALVTLDTMALSINGAFLHNCNRAAVDNSFNPCNAPNWCCAPEVFSMNLTACRNNAACPNKTRVSSLAELGKRGDFLWIFSLNVVYVAAGVAVVAVMARLLWLRSAVEVRDMESFEAKIVSADSRKDR